MEDVCLLVELGYSARPGETMENMPYLCAALLCERLMEEKDGVLSAFRIVDRFEYRIDSNIPGIKELDVKPAVPMTLFVSIKSGPVVGKHTLDVEMIRPSGATKQVVSIPLDLKEGAEQTSNFVMRMNVGAEEHGLHWFELRFDGQILTRVPLTLVRHADEKDEQTNLQNKAEH